jgi:hypothetical protein
MLASLRGAKLKARSFKNQKTEAKIGVCILNRMIEGIVKLTGGFLNRTKPYDKSQQSGTFKGHRFPSEIISYAVWVYFVSR